MKRLLYLFTMLLLIVAVSGCTGKGKLTNEKAQQAITQWLNNVGNSTAIATVTGVLELPQENSAKADVTLSNFVWNSPKNDAITAYVMGPGGEAHTYAGRADAIFAHYNDGRWVLIKIVTPMGSWDNLSIVATGEGTTRPASSTPIAAKADSKKSFLQKMKGWLGIHGKAFTATVGTDEASFILPVGKKDIWEWQIKGGEEGHSEYAWCVKVKNGEINYTFGFVEYKDGVSPQQSGDLATLIAKGEVMLWRVSSDGTMDEIPEAGVSVEPEVENVVISIRGKENVERVFSSRPEKIQFTIYEVTRKVIMKDVIVNYKK